MLLTYFLGEFVFLDSKFVVLYVDYITLWQGVSTHGLSARSAHVRELQREHALAAPDTSRHCAGGSSLYGRRELRIAYAGSASRIWPCRALPVQPAARGDSRTCRVRVATLVDL
jgi:hypothetical protein